MKICTAHLESASPYSQSRFHDIPREEKETAEDHEHRTWLERGHYNRDGFTFIPQMAFKFSLETAARFLAIQIPGKGKTLYTKHFKAGILVLEPLVLPIRKDDIEGETFHMNSTGVRGGGKRVKRTYPVIRDWAGDITFHVLDDTITKAVFERVLVEAGKLIGIGRFRPENGGFYGRFEVKKIRWT